MTPLAAVLPLPSKVSVKRSFTPVVPVGLNEMLPPRFNTEPSSITEMVWLPPTMIGALKVLLPPLYVALMPESSTSWLAPPLLPMV